MATSDELLTTMNTCIENLQAAQETLTAGAAKLGNAVHRTGNESISGTKNFASSPIVPTANADDSSTKVASTAFVARANSVVHTSGAQKVAGVKTFTASPVVPAPASTAEDSMNAAPVSYVRDMFRAEIEAQSSGRNTVIRDKNGNPNIMVVIPRFNLQDISADLGTGTHPAFIVNGVEKSEILIGKFLMSKGTAGNAQSLPHQEPWVSINSDATVSAARALGTGFGIVTNAMYAARALWLRKELGEHTYLGNTNYGRNHTYTHQVGTMKSTDYAPGDTANGDAATLTGSGPVDWNDDGTPWGISDLVGNVWERCPDLRLNDGEINIIPNSDAMLDGISLAADSSSWKAILQDGSLVAPGTANTLKFESPATNVGTNANVGAPTLATAITNVHTGDAYSSCVFNVLKTAASVVAPAILKVYGIFPLVDSDAAIQGHFWVRNYGERIALRGGCWDGAASCGPFALLLFHARTYSIRTIGGRLAFVS